MEDSGHLARLLSENKYLKVVIWFYARIMIIVGSHFYPIIMQSVGIGIEDSIIKRRREMRNIPKRVEARNNKLESDIEAVSEQFENGEITKVEEETKIEKLEKKAKEDIKEIESEAYDDDLFSKNQLQSENKRRLDKSYNWSLLSMAIFRWIVQMYLLGLYGWWWRLLFVLMLTFSILGHVLIANRSGSIKDFKGWYITDMSFTMFSLFTLFYEWMLGFV